MELFSIVIPVFNRARVVGRTLRSILDQSYRPLHLILVDNNSADDTAAVLKAWAEEHQDDDFRISVVSEMRPGAAAARNRGLAEVKSRYMMFFDSDDVMRPDAVQTYMQTFARRPQTQLVRTRVMMHPLQGKAVPLALKRGGDQLVQHLHHATLGTQRYAVRTDLMRAVGAWNPEVRIWDDWELGLRLLFANPKTVILDKITADIYESEDNITGQHYSDYASRYEVALTAGEEAIRGARLTPRRMEYLLALIQFRRIMLAALFSREGRDDLAVPLRERVLKTVSGRRRFALQHAYTYIRRGMRGAATIFGPLLR